MKNENRFYKYFNELQVQYSESEGLHSISNLNATKNLYVELVAVSLDYFDIDRLKKLNKDYEEFEQWISKKLKI